MSPPWGELLFERIVRVLSVSAWRSPILHLVWMGLVTVVLGFFATQIQIDASILGSLNDEDPQVLRLQEIRKQFPASGAMALLIEGQDPARLQLAARESAAALQAMPQVSEATAQVSPSLLMSRGLLALDDPGYETLKSTLVRTRSALEEAPDPADLGVNDVLSHLMVPSPFRSQQQNALVLVDHLSLMAGRSADLDPAELAGLPLSDGYIVSDAGDLYVVELRTQLDPITDDIGADAFAPLAQTLDEIRAQFPALTFTFAGMSAVAAQDQQAVLNRILPLSTVSLIIVLFLLWRLNRSVSAMFCVGASLLVALVWTFGLVHLVIGYASIMVMGFAVLLFGLGIDHAAHLLLRMNEALREGRSHEDALAEAWVSAGRGVVVGGGTTAMAFACMCLIDFKAAVHLGATAAMGTVCAVLLMMTLLPALLRLTARFRREPPATAPSASLISGLVRWSQTHRVWVLVPTLLLTAVGLVQCQGIELETDLEYVMTSDLPAMAANRRLKAEFGVSTEAVYSVAPTMEALRERAERLEALPEVARVEGLHQLLPVDGVERAQRNKGLLAPLGELEAVLPERIDEVRYRSGLARARKWVGTWPDTGPWETVRNQALGLLDELDGQTVERRVEALRERIVLARDAVEAETGTTSSLSEGMVDRYHSDSGYLAMIYPEDDRLDATALSQFRAAVQSVDPKAAGGLFVVDYLLVGGMERMRIALVAILVILGLFLFVDLRRPRYVLLALVPVICGSFVGLGVVMTLGQPMTLVMLSAFPLIFGIGIDDGVHIIHRYLEGSRDLPAAVAQVGQAILFTTLSTAASFAVLLGLNHNGFRGLAILVIAGVFTCFLSSVMVIPSLMTWLMDTGE